jgi:hypothetical protein
MWKITSLSYSKILPHIYHSIQCHLPEDHTPHGTNYWATVSGNKEDEIN